MSHPVARPSDKQPASDPVGAALADIAAALQAHCLLEIDRAAVLSHAMTAAAVPDVLVEAVVHRSVKELAASLTNRRTVGVVEGGAVVSARHAQWSREVMTCPVPGDRAAWLWLLTTRRVAAVEIDWATNALRAVASRLADREDVFRSSLFDGGPCSAPLLPPGPRWLLAVPTDDVADIHRLRRELGCASSLLTEASTSYLLFVAPPDSGPLNRVIKALEVSRLVATGALLTPVAEEARSLTALRTQLDEALIAQRQAHTCRLLTDCRAAVVLDRLGPVLDAAESSAEDPLGPMLTEDAGRGGQHCRTVLAWLDAHGDVSVAAASVGVHHNTFRYRLKRARTLLDLDLQDPDVRLALHLRLRRRFSHN